MEKESGLTNMLSVCQGAWETKLLSVALELELFTRISRGADTVESVSQESGIDVRLLQMMVNACRAIGLVRGKGGKLRNSPDAELFLVREKSGYIGDFVVMVGRDYYDIWRSFKEVMVTGKPVRDDQMVRLSNPRYAEAYIKAMDGISREPARVLAGELDLSKGKSMLEIGGGMGAYSAEMVKRSSIKATIFDSPFCCEFAERGIRSAGIKNVSTQGGDFEKGTIPKGHDIIMLTHVLQSIAPQKCEALLRKVHDSLPSGGVVVVNEFLLEGDGILPVFSSLFTLNAFMLSNGGMLHSRDELSEWLTNAGFSEIKPIKTSPIIISLRAVK